MKVTRCALCLCMAFAMTAFSGPDAPAHEGGGGGGGEGGRTQEAVNGKADRALALFRDGQYAAAIRAMGAILDKLPEGRKGEGNYILGSSYLRTGDYDKGRKFSLVALMKHYGSETSLWGDREKVRTLAATDFSYHASDRGDYGAIERVEEIVSGDVRIDRVSVREANGTLAGRTRLSSILSFYKARAFKNAKKAREALAILKSMAFDSGKIFVDGKVTGLSEAIEKLTAEVSAMAARFFHRALAPSLGETGRCVRL